MHWLDPNTTIEDLLNTLNENREYHICLGATRENTIITLSLFFDQLSPYFDTIFLRANESKIVFYAERVKQYLEELPEEEINHLITTYNTGNFNGLYDYLILDYSDINLVHSYYNHFYIDHTDPIVLETMEDSVLNFWPRVVKKAHPAFDHIYETWVRYQFNPVPTEVSKKLEAELQKPFDAEDWLYNWLEKLFPVK